ncbi:MAG TPA: hypothetical protein VF808_18840 [Ktedonobacterales bacterium]
MRVIINHLTRMAPGFICVAGIDPTTGAHIRPTMRGRLSRELLRENSGPFDIAGLVDLGEVTAEGVAPEIEDHVFRHWASRYMVTLTPDNFWTLLQRTARPTFTAIFGPDLEATGHTLSIAPGKGLASLGCLIPARQPHLAIEYGHSLRLLVSDGVHDLSLPVTDLRLYEADHKTIRTQAVADLNRRLLSSVTSILAVGLSRPFQKDGDAEPRHWLQVNSIHLEDHLIWQIGSTAGG